MQDLEKIMENTQKRKPLIHFITNYVTANDCANITLAAGGSPIMADDIQEVEDIIQICAALVINIGTLNQQTIPAMLKAGKKANKLKRPLILDPVGVGASQLRNKTVQTLLHELDFNVIKGNFSEIKFLFNNTISNRGVDSADMVTAENLEDAICFAKKLSVMAGSIIVITGAIDIVATSQQAYIIKNGHPLMSRVTGTGCMLGAVIGSYVSANPDAILQATVAATSVMGICGEQAFQKLERCQGGTNTYRSLLIDCMSQMTHNNLEEGMNIVCK